MGKHFNAKHDDETWMGLFRRWHAREATARALRAEAGVSADTWSANAARLGMRICDLPPDHPARRRAPAFEDRADDYRHPNSKLDEGQWRALFALRAEGVPDTVLSARFGVAGSTISTAAEARGISRAEVRAAIEGVEEEYGGETPSTTRAESPGRSGRRSHATSSTPSLRDGEETVALSGVEIVMGDPARTMASFDAAIMRAGAAGEFVKMTVACKAKLSVKQAMFGPPSREASEGSPPEVGEEARPEPVLREAQRAPARCADGSDWTTWLFLGGRGAGKTLAGAMWLSDQAEALGPGGRLAMIGPTLHDVREVMIEGASGVLSLARWRGGDRPVFEPSRRRLVFPNRAVAHVFSAEDPDSLRGPQFSAAWADEFCAWRGAESTLALLRMGLRLPGKEAPPRLMVSTTPRPTQALRALRAEPGLVETHAGTRDNAAHLAAGFVEGLERLYGGTRRAAQEIEGRVVETAGALWSAEMLAGCREHLSGGYRPSGYLSPRTPGEVEGAFDRIVVALDPTTTAGGNACGIVAAGRCGTEAVVLADRSVAGVGPLEWARRAAALAEETGAQAIVAEVNQGGDMVRTVLKAAGCSVPVREVRATKGKRVRAEPVAALYEQGRVRHAAGLGRLEEELMAFGGEDGACDFDRGGRAGVGDHGPVDRPDGDARGTAHPQSGLRGTKLGHRASLGGDGVTRHRRA